MAIWRVSTGSESNSSRRRDIINKPSSLLPNLRTPNMVGGRYYISREHSTRRENFMARHCVSALISRLPTAVWGLYLKRPVILTWPKTRSVGRFTMIRRTVELMLSLPLCCAEKFLNPTGTHCVRWPQTAVSVQENGPPYFLVLLKWTTHKVTTCRRQKNSSKRIRSLPLIELVGG